MSAALSFLGLAERAGRLTVGEDSCGIEARAKHARVILLASDAGRNSVVRAKNYAETAKCPCVPLPWTKDELGDSLGKSSVGMAAVCDFGMAAAFMDKLSAEYPGEYIEAKETVNKAAERAAQRKKEAKKHKDNLRRGKK